MRVIDLRSDTVTKPTQEMLHAMSMAQVGDDGYGEDSSVNRLEELGAEIAGKEAALFVPSGTAGNIIAVATHTERGDEVITETNSHIAVSEVAGTAVIAGVQLKTINGNKGLLETSDVDAAIRPYDGINPKTSLLCLENTHNRHGGAVIPLQQMDSLCQLAASRGVAVHLDGARLFNAAVAIGVQPARLAQHADSVMFCLSKGLCAPMGSLLAGKKEWIQAARRYRKMLGGGMRQIGYMAAAGIVAIKTMPSRLYEDHEKAAQLFNQLSQIDRLYIEPVHTNIVVFDGKDLGMQADILIAELKKKGVLAFKVSSTRVRLTTHFDVSMADVQQAATIICETIKQLALVAKD